MTKEKKETKEKVDAVEVWTAITGLRKEVKFTNENVKLTNENIKVLNIHFSTLEQKIMRLSLNFKGLEDVNGKVETLETEMKKKISTRAVSIAAIVIGAFVAFCQFIDRFIPIP